MRAETHALVRDLAQLAQAEDLKAAGVGEHGARPADEAVQPAHAADGLVAGAQIEVIGVAENDLRAQCSSMSCGTALTVPAVPTGMKTGVSTVWCGRCICARRPPPSLVLSRLNVRLTSSF